MRALIATCIAVALLATGAAATAAVPAQPAGAASVVGVAQGGVRLAPIDFTDVNAGDPFYEEIQWLSDQGITTGYPDGTFRPLGLVTREAMAAFLYRYMVADTIPACTGTTRAFTDVPAGHPFCGAIEWMKTEGISTGWDDGTFRPGQPVSREATAAFLYRMLNDPPTIPACTGTDRVFTDVPVGHPFCGAIEWMATQNISNGWPDGTFRPGLSIERQAMAAFLYRLPV